MRISRLKTEGYYILLSIDKRKKLKEYLIVKNISETEKEIFGSLNKASFKIAQENLGLSVEVKETCFLNYIPFASRNKDNEPKIEFC